MSSSTPSAQRPHLVFFGLRNAGKSSLVNAVTGQSLSIVSPVAGTTTDPVKKSMELLPLGPVVMVDTPGLDDTGDLGSLRVRQAEKVLFAADLALWVRDGAVAPSPLEESVVRTLRDQGIPVMAVCTKADLMKNRPDLPPDVYLVSAATGEGIHELKEAMARKLQKSPPDRPLVRHLLSPGDRVILVTPIDASAPKDRLILPQQQTIRDILAADGVALVTKVEQLPQTLWDMKSPPRLVITDSQAFGQVSALVPESIPMTSFSILFAAYQGTLQESLRGAYMLEHLQDGDQVLIAEGCTHHRQCNDIGTVKLPRWIRDFSHASPEFSFTSGGEFPEDLSRLKLVVHCGGCMLTPREMQRRLRLSSARRVPITNYGMAIAHIHGVLRRAVAGAGMGAEG